MDSDRGLLVVLPVRVLDLGRALLVDVQARVLDSDRGLLVVLPVRVLDSGMALLVVV